MYKRQIKKCGLNPVIVDVRCFTLKNSFDNTIFQNISERNDSTILEIGVDENYLMIIHNDTPVITDIFLRQPEKELLNSLSQTSESNAEAQAVIRRYAMQLKQALSDYEGKYDNKINNIQVISTLPNIENVIPEFKKNLPTIGFKLFDPTEGVKIPEYNSDKIDSKNKSTLSSVLGLAYRKLDIFGYYKFVTAVKNINLLPNREGMIKQKKMKAFSDFAYKGLVGAFAGIYLILFALSFWNIYSYNNKLKVYDAVVAEHTSKTNQLAKVTKELKKMTATLKLSNSLKSNKDLSYRVLAQIATSVPNRVKFDAVEYDGKRQVVITGIAAGDNDILALIRNLQSKSLITQASLSSMKMPKVKAGGQTMKGFRVFVKVKG